MIEAMEQVRTMGVVYERGVPWLIRLLGCRFRDGKASFRMKWGELGFRPGLAFALCLFSGDYGDGGRFSLHVHAFRVNVFLNLPFLSRFAWYPDEMMESWGFSVIDGAVHLNWGDRCRIVTLPWRNWRHISHEVMRPDGSWVPYVASYERDKEPDGRHVESHPYRYMLRDGTVQYRTATIHVARRRWRLRVLRWTTAFDRIRHYIDVQFDDEVGERSGSWKGGTIGCAYDLRPDETPRECLRRMQEERRFR